MKKYLPILYRIQESLQSSSIVEYNEDYEETLLLLDKLISDIELEVLDSDINEEDNEEIPNAEKE